MPRKVILVGAFLVSVSVFFPWYSDIDRFRVGNTFLGVTGPLYLAGILVFIAGALSLGIIALQLLKKPLPKLPIPELKLHVLNGGISVFMVVLAASVYFHSQFGVNLADKSAGMGMFLAIIGGSGLVLGGLLSSRSSSVIFEEEEEDFEAELKPETGSVEPLIDLDNREPQKIDKKDELTVEDAVETEKYRGKVGSAAWDQVQESINNYKRSSEEDSTNDIK